MRILKAIRIDTPTALLPMESDDDFTPKGIRQWVGNLPMGHRGETTKLLYRNLKHFNTIDIPVRDRFEIMLALVQPVDHTIQALQRHLLDQPFPLSERTILVAEIVNELLAGMVVGFRLIINAGRASNWLYQRVQQRMWIVSFYHLLRYFERILYNYRVLNISRPRGLWKGIHNMYMQTREADWHRAEIEPDDGAPAVTTIEREYKKALLVSLISRHEMRGDQFEELSPVLDILADLVRMRPASAGEAQAVCYCIPRNADSPPQAVDAKCRKECRGTDHGMVLDTSELKVHLLSLLRGADDTIVIGGHRMSRDTMELLFDSWCEPHVRKERRHRGKGWVTVALGVSYINRVIAARSPADEGHLESDAVSLDSLGETLGPMYTGQGQEHADPVAITRIVYSKPEFHRTAWTNGNTPVAYSTGEAEVVNYSAHGYCLSVRPAEGEHVRNGDVVGVYNDANDTWSLGQVRWLKGEPDREVIMGVRMIATSILPVAVRIVVGEDHHSEAMPALLGVDERAELIIVLPYLPSAREKNFVIEYRGRFTRIALTRRVAATPAFIAYNLLAGEEARVEPDQFAVQLVATHPLGKPPAEIDDEERMPAEHDRYAELWDKL